MNIILDLIILLLLMYSGYKGYKKGLVDVVIGFASIFVVIILVWLLAGPISASILKTNSAKNMEKNLQIKVEQLVGKDGENIEEIKKDVNEKNDEAAVLDFIFKMKKEEMKDKNDNLSFSSVTAKKMTSSIIKAFVSIGLFVVASLVLFVVNKVVTKTLNTFTISSALNGIGGLIVNTLKTFVIIYLLLFALRLTAPMAPKKLNDSVNNSILTKWIYNSDYLINKVIGVKK